MRAAVAYRDRRAQAGGVPGSARRLPLAGNWNSGRGSARAGTGRYRAGTGCAGGLTAGNGTGGGNG
ncbi:MAG: hypothetical protein OXH96_03865, partial [Spirochaetaceae bacterium]|nr:hypothetical protein [Spirochaetaceae bacterium]